MPEGEAEGEGEGLGLGLVPGRKRGRCTVGEKEKYKEGGLGTLFLHRFPIRRNPKLFVCTVANDTNYNNNCLRVAAASSTVRCVQ